MIGVIAFGAGLIALGWEDYRSVLAQADPLWLGVAVASLVGGNIVSTLLSGELLAARGTHVPQLGLTRMILMSNVAKYIPGFVAQVATFWQMAKRLGLERRQAMLLWVESLWLTLGVTSAAGAAALLVIDTSVPRWIAALVLLASLSSLVPRVRDRVLRAARIAPEGLDRLGGLHIRAVILAVTGTLLLGLHGVALARGLGATDLSLLEAVAAFAGGWVIGLLAIVFPGGIGPREVVASTLLADFTTPTVAVLLVVLSRLASILADVISAAFAAALPSPRVHAPESWVLRPTARANKTGG